MSESPQRPGQRWQGRRVLVTGTTGFKGAWLTELLLELGAEVTGLALAPHTTPSLFELLELNQRIDQHTVDVRDAQGVAEVVRHCAPEVIFHLAAQAVVRLGYKEPIETYDTNVMGTVHLLEAARAQPSVRALVNVTTDKVYRDAVGRPHTETDPLGGPGPYSASKACSELVTAAARTWAGERNMGLATARSGNTLGGGDWAEDRIVPDCIRAAAADEPVILRNPNAVRPWQHVLDVVWGYLTLGEHLLDAPQAWSGAWNFGPASGDEPAVGELARTLLEGLGRGVLLQTRTDPDGPRETEALRLDATRSRQLLEWRPMLPWQGCVAWTAEWYKAWLDGAPTRDTTLEQLRAYLELLSTAHDAAADDSPEEAMVGEHEGSGLECRACRAPLNRTVIDLGLSPLANSYITPAQRGQPQTFYPLHPRICDACELVQVPELASAESIFSDYAYFSSYSSSWISHCAEWSQHAIDTFGLDEQSLVVEVASNDGYMLKNFVERGIPCLGIEPADNVAQAAMAAGVPTRIDFFGERVAMELVASEGPADLLMALNVLAHVPDINDFVGGLSRLLAPDGVLHLEFPHLLGLLQGALFDTIYHEHFSYLSVTALQRVLAAAGLQIFDIQEQETHGGSLRVLARHIGSSRFPETESVEHWIQAESAYGVASSERHQELQDRAGRVRDELVELLIQARRDGKTVWGYGAPAKGNTLLNWCGVGPDLLPFTADLNPRKQGTWLPGTGIPVGTPEDLLGARPDYVLILPWNLRNEIADQLQEIRGWGGRFIVALPHLEIF